MQTGYEYIVVGSGAGGGTVAANLASAGYRVLLLEAGGAPEPYDYQVPAFHPLASENKEMAWQFFVRHYDDNTQQRRDSKFVEQEDGIFYPRAGTLGGCTAHHAMIFVYPHNSDWDGIAALTGDESWSADNMRRYFERLEDCRYRKLKRFLYQLCGYNPSRHGFKGWLSAVEADPTLVLHDQTLWRMIKRSALESFVSFGNPWERLKAAVKTSLDPNDWRSVCQGAEGIRLIPLSTDRGRRMGTRERLLAVRAAHPQHLAIQTGALATRVLFNDAMRAIGVEYLVGHHLYRADPRCHEANQRTLTQAHASREVILAGGAFNTPQLLQLSGIGPPELLSAHDIPVLLARPGVGANLQDRYEISVVQRMQHPFALLDGATMRPPQSGEQPDPYFREWQTHGTGIYTTNGAVLSIIKRSTADQPDPDLFIFGLASNFRGYYPGYAEQIQQAHKYFTWTILKAHTNNTAGRVAICSPDPCDVPMIHFRYFDEGNDTSDKDLESVVQAVEFVRRLSVPYQTLMAQEEVPGKAVHTRDQLRQFVKDEAWGHHASCSCKIGRPDDEMAVLDNNFRVYGTQNLRVVDASVFPRIPGLFIASAVYMVAEKASDVILADRE